MKLLIVLVFVAVVGARPDDDYTRYEDFDVDAVIVNKRLFKSYVQCILGSGKCTAEGNDLKKWIPEGIQNKCEKCSKNQKKNVAKVISAAQNEYPEDYDIVNKKYNPDGKYDASLKEFLETYGH